MKEKIIVAYNEQIHDSSALEWMERQEDAEIIAVNFINDDAFLLSNTAMIVGAKKVYLIDLVFASEHADNIEEYVANKLLKIAEKENASSIVATEETCSLLMKYNPPITVKSLAS